MTVPNTQILKHEAAIEQEKHHPRGSIQDGFRVCGWLWRKDPGTWRWTFTTSLHVRGYPNKADFIVVYAKPSFITDLSTRPPDVAGAPDRDRTEGGGVDVPS